LVDGVSIGAVAGHTFTNVQANHTIAASFIADVAPSNDVVVSQVYGGGGNVGSTFTHDFIELHNRSGAAVSLGGWSVQYASAAGTSWTVTPLSGSIAAGGYYLVQQAQGAGGTTSLPTPDVVDNTAMNSSAAKVALVSSIVPLTGACPSGATIVDLVGYGTTASCSEGSPTPTLGNTTAALRNDGGCMDTDNNLADFTELAPAPRNSASPAFFCEVTLTVSATPVAGGSVAVSPNQTSFVVGTQAMLTAQPAQGYHFVQWSGDASGSTNPLQVVMDADKSVTAHFALLPGPGTVVVSQVYGGGGNTGTTYRQDFIELYNRSAEPVDVTGWSVQYASALGTSWTVTPLSGSIPAGGYYLVQQAQGAGGSIDLPTPDAIGSTSMSETAAKVALVTHGVPLAGACPSGPGISDLVGYGTASCFESVSSAQLDDLNAAHRRDNGCRDTDHNLSDFTASAPTPRNSATPPSYCDFWTGVEDPAAAEFSLSAVVPNPSSHGSRVSFVLPRSATIQLDVIDLLGRKVATLADGAFPAGIHEVRWSGATSSGVARSGVYFIRLRGPGGVLMRRAIVSR
jgi:predicted extracellular nuclease